MNRWRQFGSFAVEYLATVIGREWQLAVLVLVGLAPGVATLTAWTHLALELRSHPVTLSGWLLPPILLEAIGPAGVLLGSGVVTLLIGGLGLGNAYLASVERRTPELALLRSLGLNRSRVIWLLLIESSVAGLLGSGTGVLLGLLLSRTSWPAAQSYFSLPGPFVFPKAALGIGLYSGVLAALLFMGISIIGAAGISDATVLHRPQPERLVNLQAFRTSVYGIIFAAVLTLIPALSVLELQVAFLLTGLAAALSVLLTIGGWILTRQFLRLPTPGSAPLWSLAVQGLARHPRHTAGMTLAMTAGAYAVGMAALGWVDGAGKTTVHGIFPFWVAGAVLVAGASLVLTAAALGALERRQEFGMLVALGAPPARVRRLILLEYSIVALGGGSAGSLMAFVTWALFQNQGQWWLAGLIVVLDVIAAVGSAWVGATPVLWRVARRSSAQAIRHT